MKCLHLEKRLDWPQLKKDSTGYSLKKISFIFYSVQGPNHTRDFRAQYCDRKVLQYFDNF
jgi:hypothetical protein